MKAAALNFCSSASCGYGPPSCVSGRVGSAMFGLTLTFDGLAGIILAVSFFYFADGPIRQEEKKLKNTGDDDQLADPYGQS